METEQQRDDEQQPTDAGQESPEEFKEEVENDPSTAGTDDESDRLLGG
jgi:hypothetical protein